MAIFDDNVKEVLEYTSAISDAELKHDLLVALIKGKAQYRGVDLFEQFFTNPYANGQPSSEKAACDYIVIIPLLKKLYDVASARGRLNSVRFTNRPSANSITEIKRKIESF